MYTLQLHTKLLFTEFYKCNSVAPKNHSNIKNIYAYLVYLFQPCFQKLSERLKERYSIAFYVMTSLACLLEVIDCM